MVLWFAMVLTPEIAFTVKSAGFEAMNVKAIAAEMGRIAMMVTWFAMRLTAVMASAVKSVVLESTNGDDSGS